MSENELELSIPGISFSKVQDVIFIYHSTIQALDDPYFIRFLLNNEKGCLAIQSVDRKEKDSFIVPECQERSQKFRIYSEHMLEILWHRFGWDKKKTYRCCGVLHPEYRLVEFDLKKAEIILATDVK